MPLYEYRCEECGEVFEKLVSLSKRNEPVPCPKCGSRRVGKLMSACASISKGSSTTCTTPT